jgi:hypothetical protein
VQFDLVGHEIALTLTFGLLAASAGRVALRTFHVLPEYFQIDPWELVLSS